MQHEQHLLQRLKQATACDTHKQVMSQAGFFRASLQSRGAKWIAVGWTAFIAENLILSHNRDEIIGVFGPKAYNYTYRFTPIITTKFY